MGKGHPELLCTAPSHGGSLYREGFHSVLRKNPTDECGADRNHDRALEPAPAWREVSEFTFAGEHLSAGGELAATSNSHSWMAALHKRIPLNDGRAAGGGQRRIPTR